ncbi:MULTISPECIES: recombination mediator RecR [unclassified Rothia (in: high G+C Gram-positive bacteria)]|uniref:recombination mediator RecR n=1 Tax=unclassified Rothia (in: high G+C Gram-positive bacteria) TaxID=2689056 RepID=UPI001959F91C|nr:MULTISPECIES: recombination mediator RecR [unclassified Rothia (in: high G+C Gram-positive bacteria)]MBM7052178.1 recombination protein RecR [Rothia sp. ZJ1223]QRZ61390.1 recombination protein RecR [Rothia sp. ZJ932]
MYEGAVQNLIDELGRLPGVGPKSAQRIAFYILNADPAEMAKLSGAITQVKQTVSFCEICGNVSETKQCAICRDDRRDPAALCVVEESKDVLAVERTRSFTGRYHVLGGAINPLAGVGPEQLRIRELVARLSDERIQEIILAMDPNLEGEATATYLSRMLSPIGIRVSRLASGLPVGGDLEYADEITLGRALEGRRIISEGTRFETKNAAEEFEQAVEQENAEVEARQEAEPVLERPRWSGSMFDDIEDAPASDRAAVESEQGNLNEVLLENHVQAATEGSQAEDEQERPEVPGDLEETQQAERRAAAAFDAEQAQANAERTQRQAEYERQLTELKKTPLRTAAPQIPPIPGKKYVNPWE